MKKSIKSIFKLASSMLVVFLFCIVLSKLSANSQEENLKIQEVSRNEEGISEELFSQLEELKMKISTPTSDEQFLEDAQKVLQRALKKDGVEREIVVEKLMTIYDEYQRHEAQLRSELEKRTDRDTKLILEMEQRLTELVNQNNAWSMVTPEMRVLNNQLETAQKLDSPEKILQEILLCWSSGGSTLVRNYRWVCILPIVSRNENGSLERAIGRYERKDRRGNDKYEYDSEQGIFWEKKLINDPFNVRSIGDSYLYFGEEEKALVNDLSKYTDIRVCGDVVLKLDLAFTNFSIKQDEDCKQHITITLPRPEIKEIKYCWNDKDNGIGLIQREPPFSIVAFPTRYREAWERVFSKPFCEDVLLNSAINPEDFVRNIANTLFPAFEAKGYVVTFAFADCSLESLMRKFNGLR